MVFRNIFTILCLSVLYVLPVTAQQFGGNPGWVQWFQIKTDTLRIIYPQRLYKPAAEIAALIHQIPAQKNLGVGNMIYPIDIVLQNQTLVSNGYVGMGPFRSEFQLTPLQNSFRLGSIPWHLTLGLHEYRHVQQYNNFRKGIAGIAYSVLGEEAGALLNNMAIPNWFWEGDAVFQETSLSAQGRGRIPFFYNDYKALWAAGKEYSWMKWRNGSLRDRVPSHYAMGHLLVSYGRKKFGPSIWESITDDAVRFKGFFYPFQKSFKRHTGIPYRRFREEAMAFTKDSLLAATDKDPVSNAGIKSDHILYDASFPQWINENEIVYIKEGPERVPALVSKDLRNGKEKLIRTRDISLDQHFSYRNGMIVYASYEKDLRWGWRDYGIIRKLNLSTGKEERLTRKTRYFSPDINQNGDRIIAVAINEDGSSALHLLDAGTGDLIRVFENKESYFHTYPKFLNNDKIVSAVRDEAGRMAIIQVAIETGSVNIPLPFENRILGFLNTSGDTILYSAEAKKHDGISMLVNGKNYQVQSSRFTRITGNYQPSIYKGNLVWVMPTATGNLLALARGNELQYLPDETEPAANASFQSEPGSEFSANLLKNLPQKAYTGKPYPKSFRLFNFHSLRPYISDPEYSLTIASENVLNTLRSELFLTWNRNENSKQVGFTSIYSGLFPWIQAGIDFTVDRNALSNNRRIYWNEVQPRVGISLPLNFSAGRYFRVLRAGSDFVYNKRTYQGNFKDSFDARGFSYLNSYLSYTAQVQKAAKQIYPRFAQSLNLSYRKAITRYDNNQFLASSYLYFPGLHSTHSLVLQGAFQQRDSTRLLFGNNFPYSRGYTAANFRRMVRTGINYHFPFWYPDRGFGNIIYFLRIRSNAFFDHTKVFSENLNQSREFRSTGMEIYFDTKWWNQQSISFGFRYSRLLDADVLNRSSNQWELILPVNLFSN